MLAWALVGMGVAILVIVGAVVLMIVIPGPDCGGYDV